MSIIQTKMVYKIDDNMKLEDALIELINEAENHGYYGDFVLEYDNRQYIFNIEILQRSGINWDKQEAVKYLITTNWD